MDKLVYLENQEPVTTSLIVASRTDNTHRAVFRLIKTHEDGLRRFGVLRFEITKPKGKNGGRPSEYAILNEQQVTYLVALMNNSPTVIDFKIELVKQFYAMRASLAQIATNQNNEEWKQLRANGKLARRKETDTIKRFVEYATAQGSKNAARYYSNITSMENKSLFFLQQKFDNVREALAGEQLLVIGAADQVVEKAIKEGMEQGLEYHQIYQIAKENIDKFVEIVGKSSVPAIIGALEEVK